MPPLHGLRVRSPGAPPASERSTSSPSSRRVDGTISFKPLRDSTMQRDRHEKRTRHRTETTRQVTLKSTTYASSQRAYIRVQPGIGSIVTVARMKSHLTRRSDCGGTSGESAIAAGMRVHVRHSDGVRREQTTGNRASPSQSHACDVGSGCEARTRSRLRPSLSERWAQTAERCVSQQRCVRWLQGPRIASQVVDETALSW
jgi:hypothetical protein